MAKTWINPNRYINEWGGITTIGQAESLAHQKEVQLRYQQKQLRAESVAVKQPEQKVVQTFENREQSIGEWLTF
tara:strand:- start:400 stop:621 length:222 start_codon:yes stop_codon:yes gene_type:complete